MIKQDENEEKLGFFDFDMSKNSLTENFDPNEAA